MKKTLGVIAVGTLAALGLLLAASPASPARADAEPAPSQPWTAVDDDFVVSAPPTVGSRSTKDPVTSADGYTYWEDWRTQPVYSVKLLASHGVEDLRKPLQAAAAQLQTVGVTLTIEPGTIPPRDQNAGEITVIVTDQSPCGGSNWAGCGGPSTKTPGYWESGHIWIHPVALSYSTSQLNHVMLHELGHANGLDHHDAPYLGATQVMHHSSYASADYQAGDLNGLRFMVGPAFVPGPAAEKPVVQQGSTFVLGEWPVSRWITQTSSFGFGEPGDYGMFCDWDGNGTKTVGVLRPSTATFYLTNDNGTVFASFQYGDPGWVPICGDWNGDGQDEVGVYRPNAAAFYLRSSIAASYTTNGFTYGAPGWTPVVGAWAGGSIDTIGAFDPGAAKWYLRNTNSSGVADTSFTFGNPGDSAVGGDWDGDGVATPAVTHAGTWFLATAGGRTHKSFAFGQAGDRPLHR